MAKALNGDEVTFHWNKQDTSSKTPNINKRLLMDNTLKTQCILVPHPKTGIEWKGWHMIKSSVLFEDRGKHQPNDNQCCDWFEQLCN